MPIRFPIAFAAALLALLPAAAAAQHHAPLPINPVPPVAAGGTPFAGEIAAFEAQDALTPPAKGGVLFLGSSTIRLWTDLARDFPRLHVINRGFGGSTIPDSLRYADRIVLPYAPRTIVFYAGDNDLEAGHSPEEVLADFRALVAKVHAHLPATRILFVSIKPSLSRWRLIESIRTANLLVRDYTATDPRLGYIDIFPAMLGKDGKPRRELFRPDGLHMTRAGYAIWRGAIAKALVARHPPAVVSAPAPSSPADR